MKIFSIVFLFNFIITARLLSAGMSEKTNGIYLAIESAAQSEKQITNEPFSADDKLVFVLFCETGDVELAYPTDTSFSLRVKMVSSGGQEVSRTPFGRMVGSKFEKRFDYREAKTCVIIASGSYMQNQGQGMAKFLPSPQELFDIKDPGVYTMEIQLQMFQVVKNPTNWKREKIRFSPVKIKVKKTLNK